MTTELTRLAAQVGVEGAILDFTVGFLVIVPVDILEATLGVPPFGDRGLDGDGAEGDDNKLHGE